METRGNLGFNFQLTDEDSDLWTIKWTKFLRMPEDEYLHSFTPKRLLFRFFKYLRLGIVRFSRPVTGL